jgi:hypothetical protein
MKKIFSLLAVVMLSTAMFAQTGSDRATSTDTNQPAASDQAAAQPGTPVRQDRGNDMGWIGLLGLAGLAGLMRRDRARDTGRVHTMGERDRTGIDDVRRAG